MVIPPPHISKPLGHKVVVFCGSHSPHDVYNELAYETGKALAQAGFVTVTGGGPGMMLDVNRGAKDAGGESWGICLEASEEKQHLHLTKMEIFGNLQDRHREMFHTGDAFVALPGGIGTLVDALHVTQMKKFGEMGVEVPLIFVGPYYQTMDQLFQEMRKHQFITESPHELYTMVNDPASLVTFLEAHLGRTET